MEKSKLPGDFMEEVLTIYVRIGDSIEVKGNTGTARMLLFNGDAEGSGFKGKILPGGVDTQRQLKSDPLQLSARYILEGLDSTGKCSRLFIENQGAADTNGHIQKTKPTIITDSADLSWLEAADLTGTIEPWEKGVIIHIFNNHFC